MGKALASVICLMEKFNQEYTELLGDIHTIKDEMSAVDLENKYPVTLINYLNRQSLLSLFMIPTELGGRNAGLKPAVSLLPYLSYYSVNLASLYMFHFQCTARLNNYASESLYQEIAQNIYHSGRLMSSSWSEGEQNPASVLNTLGDNVLISGNKYISTGVSESCYLHVIVNDKEFGGKSFICLPNAFPEEKLKLLPLDLIGFKSAQNCSIVFSSLSSDSRYFLGRRGSGAKLQISNHESGINPGLLALGLLARLLDTLEQEYKYIYDKEVYRKIEDKFYAFIRGFERVLISGEYFDLTYCLSLKYLSTALIRDSVLILLPLFGPSVLKERNTVNNIIQNALLLQYMGPANYQIEDKISYDLFSGSYFKISYD
ncbi:acyl-CoA dehydrogenase family protein [Photorhabdus antumapuensis]|uniref:hypothetical protein n=1 Tax=Photorhabdus antumapuensis TaxID=2862867 RepID=UPI001CED58FA|nr:hypothetical protein [Photorhabdus antumapuensis]MCA6222474.1 hypothetical protein [Photorhabdus antumapuensis]